MFKKRIIQTGMAAVLAISAISSVGAQDNALVPVETEDYGTVLAIGDGRLNGVDVAAPVAIYYTHDTALDDDGIEYEYANGVQLLAWDNETENSNLVLDATMDDLQSLADGTVSSLAGNGYSLNYKDGTFWVVAPADTEGKVYTFAWQNLSVPLAS